MSTETVVIDTSKEAHNPSLEEQAAEMGIDANSIDDTALEQPADVRPDWLPEKFKSAADMAEAYRQLEKKLGKGDTQADDNSDDGVGDDDVDSNEDTTPDKVDDNSIPEDSARQVVENAGLDFDEMSNRYWEKGEVSPEDYEALAKAGIPRHLVDQFAEGQKAVIQMERQEAFTIVGGEGNYKEMIQWASKNLSESEITAYDNAVNSLDKGARDMAIKGLAARYSGKVGFEPSRELGGNTRASTDVYESVAQLQEDMSNPKYKTDSAFRRRVEQKLGRSDIF